MTVASSHPPKAHRAAQLLKAIPAGKTLHLVWVVDPTKADYITKAQPFVQPKSVTKMVDAATLAQLDKVPRWVLKLRFPQEDPFKAK
jgi:hypothetical protein